jgi:hypothetical protein
MHASRIIITSLHHWLYILQCSANTFFLSIARHVFIIITDPERVMYASIAVT